MSSSTALAKRSSESALMPPPPPPKRIKRPAKVLDEDTYTSALSHIIARDFFPGLLETESQQDYLNALDAGDDEWIEEAEKRVREVLSTPRMSRRGVSMTPRGIGGETPRGWKGQTPVHTPGRAGQATPARSQMGDAMEGPQNEQVDLNMSLSAFQAKYTSEDNESFNKVLDKQNEKRRNKYQWLWNGNKIPSARQIAQAARDQKLLTQEQGSNHDRNSAILRTSADASQSQSLTLRPSQDQDARPASISAPPRPYDPHNTFMFDASSIDDTHPHLQSASQLAADASRAGPKSVSYTSTRLSDSLRDSLTDETMEDDASTTASAIDAAIRGNPRHRAVSTLAPSEVDTTGGETPRVNGYAFVDEEPTPSELGIPPSPPPRKSRKKGDTELLQRLIEAQGSIRGEAGNGAPNPFSIAESSSREKIHHRLVDRHLAANRISDKTKALNQNNDRLAALRGETGKTGTPRFMSSPVISRTPFGANVGRTPAEATARRRKMQAGTLTPAGRGLYEKVGRTPLRVGKGDSDRAAGSVSEERHAFDAGEKSMWTPQRILGVGVSET